MGALTLFGFLANHRLALRREDIAVLRKFADTLHAAVALLSEPRNIGKDAFSLLEDTFPIQHSGYLRALGALGPIDKRRLRTAWRAYYGDGNEQEWWLPNEYGTLLSNKVGNTAGNTKSLAIGRLQELIRICS